MGKTIMDECGQIVGTDPFNYIDMYNGKGTISEVLSGGLQIICNP